MEIRFRQVQHPQWGRRLYELQRAAYLVESQLVQYPNLPPLLESLDEFRAAGEEFLTCERDGQLLGALAFQRRGNLVDICRLVVRPDSFRQGIARRLVLSIEELIPDVETAIVQTAASNLPATNLYRKLGFETVGQEELPDGLLLVYFRKKWPRAQ